MWSGILVTEITTNRGEATRLCPAPPNRAAEAFSLTPAHDAQYDRAVDMFTRDLLLELYRHMEWADARVWGAIGSSEPADDRLRTLLVHLHTVQWAFLFVWQGRHPGESYRAPDSFASLADVRAWARPVYQVERELLSSPDSDYGRVVNLPWAAQLEAHLGRHPGPTTLGETACQVANHSTYHRGQINMRLRDLGMTPPLVDYIAWLWLDRPAPEWGP